MNEITAPEIPATQSPDVHCLPLGPDREVVLVGTAHVSQESVRLVRRVIEEVRPDAVCVELDPQRHEALTQKNRWESLDLREIIRKQQLSALAANLVMASYQKRLGAQLGVAPGAELLEAVNAAREHGIPLSLCDREIRVTLRRAWHSTPFLKKNWLLASLLASLFDSTEISEDKIAELKRKDVLAELLDEVGTSLPDLKRVVIDERDLYLAEKIKETKGKKIVAVVGAGHVSGIVRCLPLDQKARLSEINEIPPVSPFWKGMGWALPLLIVASFVVIGVQKGPAIVGASLLNWVLVTGIPAAAGAILALGHPLTILSAFASAPFTSLHPLIGVGYVTALVQVMRVPPLVSEFEAVLDDMASVGGWWRNRLLRVLLAFLLPSFGTMVGVWIGGARLVAELF